MWLAGVHRKRESFARSRNGSTLVAIGRDRCSIGGAPLSRIDTSVLGECVAPPLKCPRAEKRAAVFFCCVFFFCVWHFLRLIDDEQVRGWSLDAMFSRQPSITSGPSCHSSFNTTHPPPSSPPARTPRPLLHTPVLSGQQRTDQQAFPSPDCQKPLKRLSCNTQGDL